MAKAQAGAAPKRKAVKKPAGTAKRKKAADTGPAPPERPDNSLKGVFAKDLPDIMVAYGESTARPVPETVDALEGLTVAFVRDVITKALDHASVRPKIDEADICFVLRKDRRKASRAQELLSAQKQYKQMRAIMKTENPAIEDVQAHLNTLVQDDEGDGGGGSGQGGGVGSAVGGSYGGEDMMAYDDDDPNAVL